MGIMGAAYLSLVKGHGVCHAYQFLIMDSTGSCNRVPRH
uniref:Uncharacterized protein n=1 Tax=Arundo donax TaxID=35708 RepID=A0A0A9BLB3_ARUDO